jgi:ice-binding like protein
MAGSEGIAGAVGTAGATGNGGSAGSPGADGGIDGGIVIAPGHPVSLGSAGDYVILAKTGISTVPASVIIGDLGVSPIAAIAITGFSLTADSTNVFSRSPQVTGKVYAANYASPTPSNLTTAVGDMQLAFTDAAGRPPGVTELGAGNIGGMTLVPGVYKWSTGLLIPTNVTLTGSATDVWIFQISKSLTMSSGAKIVLGGAALPKNVFWQVAGLVSVGTTAHLEGIVLSQTSVTLGTGASVNGRLLAQTAVALQVSTVVAPAP